MRAAILAAITISLGFTATSHAQAFSCTDAAKSAYDKCMAKESPTCQKGLGSCKYGCCQPPPCEYYYDLTMWKMLQALFADAEVLGCSTKDTIQNDITTIGNKSDPFQTALPNCSNEYMGRTLRSRPTLQTGTSFSDAKSCSVSADGLTVTQKSEGMGYTTCNELIAIDFAHEAVHLAVCNALNAKQGNGYEARQTLASIAKEEVKGYQVSIKKVKKELRNWNMGCSAKKLKRDTNKAVNDAKTGITALKAAAQAKAAGGCK